MRSAGSLTAAAGASPVAVLVGRTGQVAMDPNRTKWSKTSPPLAAVPANPTSLPPLPASSRRLFHVRFPRVLGVERLIIEFVGFVCSLQLQHGTGLD